MSTLDIYALAFAMFGAGLAIGHTIVSYRTRPRPAIAGLAVMAGLVGAGIGAGAGYLIGWIAGLIG